MTKIMGINQIFKRILKWTVYVVGVFMMLGMTKNDMVEPLRRDDDKNPCHDQARTGCDNYYIHYFNLGATGRAAGISPDVLLRTTDRKNTKARDMIQQGIDYYDENYGN